MRLTLKFSENRAKELASLYGVTCFVPKRRISPGIARVTLSRRHRWLDTKLSIAVAWTKEELRSCLLSLPNVVDLKLADAMRKLEQESQRPWLNSSNGDSSHE